MSTDPKAVVIFTDGACSPNPGPGGYGVIIVQDGRRTELAGGFRNTTNNRMELLAAIEGLRALDGEGCDDSNGFDVTIFSDSRYLVDMLNGGHAAKWRVNGWKLASRKRALNIDLWGELLDLAGNRRVRFEWVRGHNEHPENERCDEMAVEARQTDDLPPDEGYEEAVRIEPEQTEFGWL